MVYPRIVSGLISGNPLPFSRDGIVKMSEIFQWIVLALACIGLLYLAITLIVGRLIIRSFFGDRDSVDLHEEFLSISSQPQIHNPGAEFSQDANSEEVSLWRKLVEEHKSGRERKAARIWRDHLNKKNDSRIA